MAAIRRGDTPFVVGAVSLAHFLSHVFLLAYPPLFPLLADEFEVSIAQLGLLVTAIYIPQLFLQLPLGEVVDRVGAKWILVSGLSVTALSIGASGLATTYWMLLGFAFVSGIGQSVFHPADYALLETVTTAENEGIGFSAHTFGGYAGFAAAPVAIGTIGIALSWQVALLGAGTVGALVAIGVALTTESVHAKKIVAASAKGTDASPGIDPEWKVENRDVENRDVEDREVENRDVEDREVENRDVEDREVENREVEDTEVEAEEVETGEVEVEEVEAGAVDVEKVEVEEVEADEDLEWEEINPGEETTTGETEQGTLAQMLTFVKQVDLFLVFVFYLVSMMALVGLQSFTTVLAVDAYGFTESSANTLLTVHLTATAIGVIVGGPLADRASFRWVVVGLFVLSAMGVWTLLLLVPTTGYLVALAMLALIGLLFGLALPSRDKFANSVADPDAVGKSFGFFFTGLSLGAVVSPVLLGVIIDTWSAPTAFVVVGLLLVAAASVVVWTMQVSGEHK